MERLHRAALANAGFVPSGRYRLNWTSPAGKFVGANFDDWGKLEAFSKKLIDAGLCPKVPSSCPTPYDSGRYNAEAVQKAIDRDPRIKPREARAIHRVLKGRG